MLSGTNREIWPPPLSTAQKTVQATIWVLLVVFIYAQIHDGFFRKGISMNKSRTKLMLLLTAAAMMATSLTLAQAQGPGGTPPDQPGGAAAKIEGSYKVVLTLPKAKPTAVLTFCGSGEPFAGAWVEDGGQKFVGEMYNKKINGNEYIFTVKAGPGIWDFVVTSDGQTLKGTVTGDGATSPFEGPKTKLDKEFCTK